MNYPLNALCHLCLLPYDNQFLMHFFRPLKTIYIQNFPGGGGGPGLNLKGISLKFAESLNNLKRIGQATVFTSFPGFIRSALIYII